MGHASTGLARAQESWFRDVNRFAAHTSWLHTPMRLYASYGIVVFAVLLVAGWWIARRSGDLTRVALSLWAPVGVLVALAINQPIANAVAEPRPYAAFPHVLVLVSRHSDYSFPSDHAVMAGAVALALAQIHRTLGWVAVGLALLMAFARVYVGAHFPLDVVVGLGVGALISWAGFLMVRRPLTGLLTAASRTRLAILIDGATPR